MENFDILLSQNDELQSLNGDFLTGDASNNYICDILSASPGHYKMAILVGANLWQFLNAKASPATIERAIRKQLESDVFKSPDIDVTAWPTIYVNKVKIDAA